MSIAHDNRITRLLGIELPILQAPMAGASTAAMAIAVSEAGGLGSMPGALLSVDQMRDALESIRAATSRPFGVNFFVHTDPGPNAAEQLAWKRTLSPYYREVGLDPGAVPPGPGRAPFAAAYCALVEAYRPAVVSFHFGLPADDLLQRVKQTGAKVLSSATTVTEARWLEQRGVDAVIAMGVEAGGHRGTFLTGDMTTQVGTFALVPQIVDAVSVPVIAAGGIADPRGVRAAFALGASAVQVGTAYLLTPEANITPLHREALRNARDDGTALTNVFTGRPARGMVNRLVRELGPLSKNVPAFPTAAAAIAPLRAAMEKAGKVNCSPLWSGQSAALAREMSSAQLTRYLAGVD